MGHVALFLLQIEPTDVNTKEYLFLIFDLLNA